MTTSTTQSPTFTENLRAPGWIFAFLGLTLGGVSGGLTAVGIRSFGDEPLISGSEALLFYVAFAIGIVGIVYVMLNSTLMETKATEDGITVRLGVLGTQRSGSWRGTRYNCNSRDRSQYRAAWRTRQSLRSFVTRRSWTMYGVRSWG